MSKKPSPVIVMIILAGCAIWISTVSDVFIEVNSMTGAHRTRTRYAYLFETPWKTQSTWVAESANQQGIDTERGWQSLSVISKRFPATSRGCSRAPASYLFAGAGSDVFEFQSPEDADQFVRDFVTAQESKRKEMIESQRK